MEGLDAFFTRLDGYMDDMLEVIYQCAQDHEWIMELAAKTGARWTDRTGNARQSLNAKASQDAIETLLRLAHGVDYGKWLELAHSGKYAILWETISQNADDFLEDLYAALQKIGVHG